MYDTALLCESLSTSMDDIFRAKGKQKSVQPCKIMLIAEPVRWFSSNAPPHPLPPGLPSPPPLGRRLSPPVTSVRTPSRPSAPPDSAEGLGMRLLSGRGGYNSDDVTKVGLGGGVGGLLSQEAVMTE